MAGMYVVTQGATVRLSRGRVVVEVDGKVLGLASLDRLSELVVVGRSGITVPAMRALLDRGVHVVLLSRMGRVRGRLVAPVGKNHPRRKALYERSEDAQFCLDFAREVVTAKIGNSRTMAGRWARDLVDEGQAVPDSLLERMDALASAAETAADLAALRNMEGRAARLYFRVFRARLDPAWKFPRRSRRPPADPANALLGLLYSLLTQSCVSALEVAGLDPYEGLYHADKYGRPALALDLVEEFRAYVADSLMLRLTNRSMLDPDDFHDSRHGPRLGRRGWSVVLDQYSARLDERILLRELDRRLSLRQILELQARRIAALVDGRTKDYRPFRTR